MAEPTTDTQAREKLGLFPLSAIEYAKIEAVKSRIQGLRMGLVASGIVGGLLSTLVLVTSSAMEAGRLALSGSANFWVPLALTIAVAIPFIAICAYLSYRVNKHIDRLSRGKFEPRIVFEDD